MDSDKNADLGRMYSLVARITEGLKELKHVLEEHIHNQGVAVVAKCGDAAINVCVIPFHESDNREFELIRVFRFDFECRIRKFTSKPY